MNSWFLPSSFLVSTYAKIILAILALAVFGSIYVHSTESKIRWVNLKCQSLQFDHSLGLKTPSNVGMLAWSFLDHSTLFNQDQLSFFLVADDIHIFHFGLVFLIVFACLPLIGFTLSSHWFSVGCCYFGSASKVYQTESALDQYCYSFCMMYNLVLIQKVKIFAMTI